MLRPRKCSSPACSSPGAVSHAPAGMDLAWLLQSGFQKCFEFMIFWKTASKIALDDRFLGRRINKFCVFLLSSFHKSRNQVIFWRFSAYALPRYYYMRAVLEEAFQECSVIEYFWKGASKKDPIRNNFGSWDRFHCPARGKRKSRRADHNRSARQPRFI